MIHYKTSEEVDIIKESADILGRAHGEVAKYVKEGVKTSFLDKIAEEYIRDHQGVPSFKGYNGFPAALCISVNEVVVHGFPSDYELKDGDIISVDCGVFHQGFHSDSAYTYPIGEVSPSVLALLKATKDSLYLGIEKAVFGNRLGDVGNTIQKFVEAKGYTVVRELVGHGIGRNLHESPEVPNYGKKGSGPLLKAGMVIAIEPMVNLGTRNIVQERDGWTIRTADRKPSAHYEHTVAIFEDKTEVLTTHKYIEENFKF
ncbi:type I methionyl aminopeptidase [Algoriphagus lutimaris]|uniref:Methionine aminopeptidase n=1 Tax=Algoriphagus halophilus TaxID=226505 RepID=A0A1N6HYG4_9BACT|nr:MULTISPECIES: type I methionyl aminopeptidase [Algoriphagus]MBN3521713.1 type I methionyl aminopeptidase [Algoriphagus lutimaris]SIO24801.1 methionine aminopeptidase, type I [Algoriphagus halophilus]